MLLLVYRVETLIGPYSIFTTIVALKQQPSTVFTVKWARQLISHISFVYSIGVKTPSASLVSGLLKYFSNYLLVFSHSENYSVHPGLSLSNRSSGRWVEPGPKPSRLFRWNWPAAERHPLPLSWWIIPGWAGGHLLLRLSWRRGPVDNRRLRQHVKASCYLERDTKSHQHTRQKSVLFTVYDIIWFILYLKDAAGIIKLTLWQCGTRIRTP